MSSMNLQPNPLELCQGSTLRGRRRSSIRPKNVLPFLFTPGTSPPNQNESAVTDDAYPSEYEHKADAFSPPLALISPISDAHMPGHSSSFNTSRHHDALSTHKSILTASPSGSATTSDSYFETRVPVIQEHLRLRLRLASCLFLYFTSGWGDGVTGTALPYFRAEFNLTYTTSSLLFVATTCGFCVGTLLVPRIMQFTGRFYLSDLRLPVLPISPFRILFSRPPSTAIGYSASQARYLALILFSFLPLASFIMMGSKSGFYSLFMGYVVSSFGRSVLTASLNVFLSSMPSKPFGYAFGAWGLGAVASPLIFQVTTAGGVPWNYFYYGSLVPAGITVAFLGITFMPTPREFTQDRTNALDQADSIAERFNADTEPQISVPQPITAPVNELRLAFSMRYLWAVALFSLFYCGTETTTQGFIVQYLLAERSADRDTVGYVSSGFWAGISISRIFWSYFSPRISFSTRKYICQASIAFALAMNCLIWFINSTIENAFSTCLIGIVYGPIWPASLELANDLLPSEVSMIGMAIISSFGSLGSAILPFITGLVASRYTLRSWSYITVIQNAILFCAWYMFPTRLPRGIPQ